MEEIAGREIKRTLESVKSGQQWVKFKLEQWKRKRDFEQRNFRVIKNIRQEEEVKEEELWRENDRSNGNLREFEDSVYKKSSSG